MIERHTSKVENKLKEEEQQFKKRQETLSLMRKIETRRITPKMIDTAVIIVEQAKQYEVSPKLALAITHCESYWNADAIHYNDGGKGKHSIGAYQFQESTFKDWSKQMGEDLDYHSLTDQSKVASYMLAHNQKHQWTCSKMI